MKFERHSKTQEEVRRSGLGEQEEEARLRLAQAQRVRETRTAALAEEHSRRVRAIEEAAYAKAQVQVQSFRPFAAFAVALSRALSLSLPPSHAATPGRDREKATEGRQRGKEAKRVGRRLAMSRRAHWCAWWEWEGVREDAGGRVGG